MTVAKITERKPPAIRRLYRVLDEVLERPGVSASRARQLRWVVGELERAVGREGMPKTAGARLEVLLGARAVDAYLKLAASGVLRRVPVAHPERASEASLQVRRQCLRILAEAAGRPVRRVPVPVVPLRPTVPEAAQRELFRHLARMAAAAPESPGRARLLAVVGVVLDTGVRVGELCALGLDDVTEELDAVRVVRRPQARRYAPLTEEWVELSEPTRVALGIWLRFRSKVVAALEGGPVTALWVSLTGQGMQSADGRILPVPPGMPLQPRGMTRAYAKGIRALNAEMAGTPGWEPLPTRLEALRRSVTLEDRPPVTRPNAG